MTNSPLWAMMSWLYLFLRMDTLTMTGSEQTVPAQAAVMTLYLPCSSHEVISTAGTLYLNGETIWTIKEAAAYKKYHPVKTLRRLGSVKEAAGMEAGK